MGTMQTQIIISKEQCSLRKLSLRYNFILQSLQLAKALSDLTENGNFTFINIITYNTGKILSY